MSLVTFFPHHYTGLTLMCVTCKCSPTQTWDACHYSVQKNLNSLQKKTNVYWCEKAVLAMTLLSISASSSAKTLTVLCLYSETRYNNHIHNPAKPVLYCFMEYKLFSQPVCRTVGLYELCNCFLSHKLEHFPFKKVTATSGGGAGQELARSSDGSGGISKLFQLTVPLACLKDWVCQYLFHRVNTTPSFVYTGCIGCETDAAGRLEKGNLREEKKQKNNNLWNDARATASLPPKFS